MQESNQLQTDLEQKSPDGLSAAVTVKEEENWMIPRDEGAGAMVRNMNNNSRSVATPTATEEKAGFSSRANDDGVSSRSHSNQANCHSMPQNNNKNNYDNANTNSDVFMVGGVRRTSTYAHSNRENMISTSHDQSNNNNHHHQHHNQKFDNTLVSITSKTGASRTDDNYGFAEQALTSFRSGGEDKNNNQKPSLRTTAGATANSALMTHGTATSDISIVGICSERATRQHSRSPPVHNHHHQHYPQSQRHHHDNFSLEGVGTATATMYNNNNNNNSTITGTSNNNHHSKFSASHVDLDSAAHHHRQSVTNNYLHAEDRSRTTQHDDDDDDDYNTKNNNNFTTSTSTEGKTNVSRQNNNNNYENNNNTSTTTTTTSPTTTGWAQETPTFGANQNQRSNDAAESATSPTSTSSSRMSRRVQQQVEDARKYSNNSNNNAEYDNKNIREVQAGATTRASNNSASAVGGKTTTTTTTTSSTTTTTSSNTAPNLNRNNATLTMTNDKNSNSANAEKTTTTTTTTTSGSLNNSLDNNHHPHHRHQHHPLHQHHHPEVNGHQFSALVNRNVTHGSTSSTATKTTETTGAHENSVSIVARSDNDIAPPSKKKRKKSRRASSSSPSSSCRLKHNINSDLPQENSATHVLGHNHNNNNLRICVKGVASPSSLHHSDDDPRNTSTNTTSVTTGTNNNNNHNNNTTSTTNCDGTDAYFSTLESNANNHNNSIQNNNHLPLPIPTGQVVTLSTPMNSVNQDEQKNVNALKLNAAVTEGGQAAGSPLAPARKRKVSFFDRLIIVENSGNLQSRQQSSSFSDENDGGRRGGGNSFPRHYGIRHHHHHGGRNYDDDDDEYDYYGEDDEEYDECEEEEDEEEEEEEEGDDDVHLNDLSSDAVRHQKSKESNASADSQTIDEHQLKEFQLYQQQHQGNTNNSSFLTNNNNNNITPPLSMGAVVSFDSSSQAANRKEKHTDLFVPGRPARSHPHQATPTAAVAPYDGTAVAVTSSLRSGGGRENTGVKMVMVLPTTPPLGRPRTTTSPTSMTPKPSQASLPSIDRQRKHQQRREKNLRAAMLREETSLGGTPMGGRNKNNNKNNNQIEHGNNNEISPREGNVNEIGESVVTVKRKRRPSNTASSNNNNNNNNNDATPENSVGRGRRKRRPSSRSLNDEDGKNSATANTPTRRRSQDHRRQSDIATFSVSITSHPKTSPLLAITGESQHPPQSAPANLNSHHHHYFPASNSMTVSRTTPGLAPHQQNQLPPFVGQAERYSKDQRRFTLHPHAKKVDGILQNLSDKLQRIIDPCHGSDSLRMSEEDDHKNNNNNNDGKSPASLIEIANAPKTKKRTDRNEAVNSNSKNTNNNNNSSNNDTTNKTKTTVSEKQTITTVGGSVTAGADFTKVNADTIKGTKKENDENNNNDTNKRDPAGSTKTKKMPKFSPSIFDNKYRPPGGDNTTYAQLKKLSSGSFGTTSLVRWVSSAEANVANDNNNNNNNNSTSNNNTADDIGAPSPPLLQGHSETSNPNDVNTDGSPLMVSMHEKQHHATAPRNPHNMSITIGVMSESQHAASGNLPAFANSNNNNNNEEDANNNNNNNNDDNHSSDKKTPSKKHRKQQEEKDAKEKEAHKVEKPPAAVSSLSCTTRFVEIPKEGSTDKTQMTKIPREYVFVCKSEQIPDYDENGGGGEEKNALNQSQNNNNNDKNSKNTKHLHASQRGGTSVESEKEILSNCAHPNIVGYVDSFSEDGYHHTIMEYVDGGDLDEFLKKVKTNAFNAQINKNNQRNVVIPTPRRFQGSPGAEHHHNSNNSTNNSSGTSHTTSPSTNAAPAFLSERFILFIYCQILLAVEYLHRHNILHRDLKNANILLSKRFICKLADFGLSKQFDRDVDTHVSHTALGTPLTACPQLCLGQPYDQKADIWATGCILFELVTLKKPFEGATVKQLLQNIVNSEPRRITRLDISKDLRTLIGRILAKSADERPSAKEILRMPLMQSALAHYATRFSSLVLSEGSSSIDRTWDMVLREHIELVSGEDDATKSSCKSRASMQRTRRGMVQKRYFDDVVDRERLMSDVKSKSKIRQIDAKERVVGDNVLYYQLPVLGEEENNNNNEDNHFIANNNNMNKRNNKTQKMKTKNGDDDVRGKYTTRRNGNNGDDDNDDEDESLSLGK